MKRVLKTSQNTKPMKQTFKPSANTGTDSQQAITASNSLDLFTVDDIIALMSNIEEMKDMYFEPVNCGDGLWEFLVGDNTYQVQTSPI